MDTSPYDAPTYFAPSYFVSGIDSSTSIGVAPYNAPTYFSPSYFYGSSSTSISIGVAPYNAPTYFSPSYFYGASSSSTSIGVSPYDAPTYFAPSYFFGGEASPSPVPVVSDPKGRDEDAYRSLIALIQATGVFGEALLGTTIQRNQAGADGYPLAIVTPRGWEESDDYDPISLLRRASFGIKIVVKSEDGSPQFNELDRLSTAILNVVDGSDLQGTCLPALTRIRSGQFDSTSHFPEQSLELDGEFSSIVVLPASVSPPS